MTSRPGATYKRVCMEIKVVEAWLSSSLIPELLFAISSWCLPNSRLFKQERGESFVPYATNGSNEKSHCRRHSQSKY